MTTAWLRNLPEQLAAYLHALRIAGQVGQYRPAVSGLTPVGEQIRLGMSCYAHKIYYMLGLWDELDTATQHAWNAYIQSYQQSADAPEQIARAAFIDPVVEGALRGKEQPAPWYKMLFRGNKALSHRHKVIIAETKQAIATLTQVGATTNRPFAGYPQTPRAVRRYLNTFDWRNPWDAGAHAATLAVFYDEQAAQVVGEAQARQLSQAVYAFLTRVADPETGGYYLHERPDLGILTNGAMKVLTALDWLQAAIHYPNALIDSVLQAPPPAEGCYVVDAIYVLYRCQLQTDHRRGEIVRYCEQVMGMIQAHFVPDDGGFSYYVGRSQPVYYGVRITTGEAVADLHGTILLVWALAMIFNILGRDAFPRWRIIRP